MRVKMAALQVYVGLMNHPSGQFPDHPSLQVTLDLTKGVLRKCYLKKRMIQSFPYFHFHLLAFLLQKETEWPYS